MKAILTQNSSIQAQTIKRFASHYHDETFNDQHIASATSIRKQLFSENSSFAEIEPFIPKATAALLASYKQNYGILHSWEQYFFIFQIQTHDDVSRRHDIYMK
ncbi:UPF0348 protein family [Bacillus cereus]|nr:UPF0348 protein family [Bacillus cereus]